jgi:hypothetical protein
VSATVLLVVVAAFAGVWQSPRCRRHRWQRLVSAVAGFEMGELAKPGVGGEGVEPPPVRISEGQLGAGMWSFDAGSPASRTATRPR